MLGRIFGKSKSKKSHQKKPREIAVRVIRSSQKPKPQKLDIEDMKKEYEIEEKGLSLRSYSILSGGGIGAFVGLLFIVLMLRFGANLSSYEIAFMIGIPAFLGAAAGYVIF